MNNVVWKKLAPLFLSKASMMQNMTTSLSLFFFVFVLSVLLSGCGGGGGGDAPNTSTKTGVFIDAPVNGLAYKATPSNKSGFTNTGGEFQYEAGDEVTFYLGELELTTQQAQSVISILQDSNGVNLATMLIALDSDLNPENGIHITSEVANIFDRTIAFNSSQVDSESNEFQGMFKLLTGRDLPPKHIAYNHAKQSLALKILEDTQSNLYLYFTGNMAADFLSNEFSNSTEVESKLLGNISNRVNLYAYNYLVLPDIQLQIALIQNKFDDIEKTNKTISDATSEAGKIFSALWAAKHVVDNTTMAQVGSEVVNTVKSKLTADGLTQIEQKIPVLGAFTKRAVTMALACKPDKNTTLAERASVCAAEMTGQAVSTINDSIASVRYAFALEKVNRYIVLNEILRTYFTASKNWQWVYQRYNFVADANATDQSQMLALIEHVANKVLANEASIFNYVFTPSPDFDTSDAKAVREMLAVSIAEAIQYSNNLVQNYGLAKGYDPVKQITTAGSASLSKLEIDRNGTLTACYEVTNNTGRAIGVDFSYRVPQPVLGLQDIQKTGSYIVRSWAKRDEHCTLLKTGIEGGDLYAVELSVKLSIEGTLFDTYNLDSIVMREYRNLDTTIERSINAHIPKINYLDSWSNDVTQGKSITLVAVVTDGNHERPVNLETNFTSYWQQNSGNKQAIFNGTQNDRVAIITLPDDASGCYAFEYTIVSNVTAASATDTVFVNIDDIQKPCITEPVTPIVTGLNISNTPMNTATDFILTGRHFPTGMQVYIQGANCPEAARLRQSETSYSFTCSHHSEQLLKLVVENSDGSLIDNAGVQISFYQAVIQGAALQFDYPIGDRGISNGNIVTTSEGISPEKNTAYKTTTVTIDNYSRLGSTNDNNSWVNTQDVGSFYGVMFGIHPGEDWNLGSGNNGAGQAVYAVADGKVVLTRSTLSDYKKGAWTIVIEHKLPDNTKIYSIYTHVTASDQPTGKVVASLENLSVKKGDLVNRGEQIARLAHGDDMSAMSSAHLHFEMRTKDPIADLWANDNGWGYYSHDKTRNHSSMTATQIKTAMAIMHQQGIIDPSDFIDLHRYGVTQLAQMRVDSISPLNVTPGTTQIFTITGNNLPSSLAMSLHGATCGKAYNVTATSAVIECVVPHALGDIRFYVAANPSGVILNGAETLTITVGTVVVDTTKPVVTAPARLTIISASDIPATDSRIQTFLASATAQDNIDGDITASISHNIATDYSFITGVAKTVKFTVSDSAGNVGLGLATVEIELPSVLQSELISSFTISQLSPIQGSTIQLSSTIFNPGSIAFDDKFQFAFILSNDAVLDAGDSALFQSGSTTFSLPVNTQDVYAYDYQVPNDLVTGNHYILACMVYVPAKDAATVSYCDPQVINVSSDTGVSGTIISGLASGSVTFQDTNGNTTSIPADAWAGITPTRFANDASNWNRLTCKIDQNGNFGNECYFDFDEAGLRAAFNDTSETFQLGVFKNHIEPLGTHWDCGENVYRFVGEYTVYGQWSSIVVQPNDFQDRSSEQCGNTGGGSSSGNNGYNLSGIVKNAPVTVPLTSTEISQIQSTVAFVYRDNNNLIADSIDAPEFLSSYVFDGAKTTFATTDFVNALSFNDLNGGVDLVTDPELLVYVQYHTQSLNQLTIEVALQTFQTDLNITGFIQSASFGYAGISSYGPALQVMYVEGRLQAYIQYEGDRSPLFGSLCWTINAGVEQCFSADNSQFNNQEFIILSPNDFTQYSGNIVIDLVDKNDGRTASISTSQSALDTSVNQMPQLVGSNLSLADDGTLNMTISGGTERVSNYEIRYWITNDTVSNFIKSLSIRSNDYYLQSLGTTSSSPPNSADTLQFNLKELLDNNGGGAGLPGDTSQLILDTIMGLTYDAQGIKIFKVTQQTNVGAQISPTLLNYLQN